MPYEAGGYWWYQYGSEITERSRSSIRERKGWLKTKWRNTSRNENGLHISYYANFYNNHKLSKMNMTCCQGTAHCMLIFTAAPCGHEVDCKTTREKEKRDQEETNLMGRSNHRETICLDISSSVSELNTGVHLPELLCIATSGTVLIAALLLTLMCSLPVHSSVGLFRFLLPGNAC